jgi:hypothetical protein
MQESSAKGSTQPPSGPNNPASKAKMLPKVRLRASVGGEGSLIKQTTKC